MTLRRWVARIAVLAIVLTIGLDIWRHTVIDLRPRINGDLPCVWVDYGRIHVSVGGDVSVGSALRFNVLWWPVQRWSWGRPGHLQPIGKPGEPYYYEPRDHPSRYEIDLSRPR